MRQLAICVSALCIFLNSQSYFSFLSFILGSSILELQATLVGLIERFDFSPPPGIEIQGAPAGSMIPVIRGRASEGTQLPLVITPLERSIPV